MYALHALWRVDRRLALWAEDADDYRSGRPATGPAHPYACPAAVVAELLGGIGPRLGWLADQGAERWTSLRLPSRGNRPTPSPDLPVGTAPAPATLDRWRVPSLLFEPAEAAQLLGELFDPRHQVAVATRPDGRTAEVGYGASLRWLTAVHDLAWRLVGHGRILPVLRHTGGGGLDGGGGLYGDGSGGGALYGGGSGDGGSASRGAFGGGLDGGRSYGGALNGGGSYGGAVYGGWQAAPDPLARRQAARLAAGCPPICRAEQPAGSSGDAWTRARLVGELLDVFVDQEVRAALTAAAVRVAEGSVASAVPAASASASASASAAASADAGVASAADSAVARWLAALRAADGAFHMPPVPSAAPSDGPDLGARLAAWFAGRRPADPATGSAYGCPNPSARPTTIRTACPRWTSGGSTSCSRPSTIRP